MQNQAVRKFTAFSLMIVMVLCCTPTIVLHALFANHQDQTTIDLKDKQVHITVTGIDCHCVGNVTTAPYLPSSFEWTTAKIEFNYIRFSPVKKNIGNGKVFHFSLRAPPVMI